VGWNGGPAADTAIGRLPDANAICFPLQWCLEECCVLVISGSLSLDFHERVFE
jgi:hypothetical protein